MKYGSIKFMANRCLQAYAMPFLDEILIEKSVLLSFSL